MNKVEDAIKKWNSIQPLSQLNRNRLERKFLLDFNYNSNHIEGNTLTYGQTEVLLLLGEVIGSAKMKDLEDMKAHNLCLKMMQTEALSGNKMTETFIRQLHLTMLREDYTLYRKLPSGENTSYIIHAGCYKTRPNSVITPTGARFEYASVEETPSLMCDLVSWYNSSEGKGILSPVELAALFHYRYIRIHPFEDGNGRIARLMVNYILLKHNYPMIVVRSRKKQSYLRALSLADATVGIIPSNGAHATIEKAADFVEYIKDLFVSEVNQSILYLTEDADKIWWYDGELVKFRSNNTSMLLQYLNGHSHATLSEIATYLNINVSAVQKQLKSLSEKGYIIKETNPKRWRVIIVSTTK
ncbi:MAG TPA: Fic family protein [Candidatus Egerieousia sp.]|nr:Fic family protein [Candidatus Egerieousia sp.]